MAQHGLTPEDYENVIAATVSFNTQVNRGRAERTEQLNARWNQIEGTPYQPHNAQHPQAERQHAEPLTGVESPNQYIAAQRAQRAAYAQAQAQAAEAQHVQGVAQPQAQQSTASRLFTYKYHTSDDVAPCTENSVATQTALKWPVADDGINREEDT